MAHIAVIGKPTRQRFQVTNQLQLQLGMHVNIFTSYDEATPTLNTGSLSLVVMLGERLGDSSLLQMDEFCEKYEEIGLLFVARDVTATARAQFVMLGFKNCTLLDHSRESEHLKPVVRKMLQNKPVFVRKHFRHKVNQLAYLNSARHIQNSRVRVMDISKGGLMASYKNMSIRAGETVHILMGTEDGTKQHRIVGKVVWHNENARQFGVQYLSVSVELASVRHASAK